jgi:hypothetical protein
MFQNVQRRCENFVSLFAPRFVTQKTERYGPVGGNAT